ncbi:hypothetical protein DIE14_27440 [Burkholderia sp. Bp9017]|nr:hypothetical protein DIE14_27440 [Burkholderia sp. Bp9017]
MLPDQQSVQRFASRGKHRFLITKAGLLRSARRRRTAALRRRIGRHRVRRGSRAAVAIAQAAPQCC